MPWKDRILNVVGPVCGGWLFLSSIVGTLVLAAVLSGGVTVKRKGDTETLCPKGGACQSCDCDGCKGSCKDKVKPEACEKVKPTITWAEIVAIGKKLRTDNETEDAEADKPIVEVVGPTEYLAGSMVTLNAEGTAAKFVWGPDADLVEQNNVHIDSDGKTLVFTSPVAGKFTFSLAGVDAAGFITVRQHTVAIIAPSPPGPTPDPPNPVPPVPPPPAPGQITVLIVEETEERTPAMALLQGSTKLREYLNSHCEKGDKGRPMWLWTDDDAEFKNAHKVWQDAMKLPRQSVPWLIVLAKGGATLHSGPLPAKTDAVLATLKKYGGD